MEKLSILFTVSFGVVLMVTGCGRPETAATETSAGAPLVKLTADQLNDVQQFAVAHPEEISTPPVMPTPTEAGARGIYLRFTPTQVTNLYNWAQQLYANGDGRADRVANWFNHIVSVKCNRFPNGPVCTQYGQ